MTERYEYTFEVITKKVGTSGHDVNDWHTQYITVQKTVTDRMEERGSAHKFGYAVRYFNKFGREHFGWNADHVRTGKVRKI